MLWFYLVAYGLGLMSIFSPCSFILIPILFSDFKKKFKSTLLFLSGVFITYFLLGTLAVLTGKLLTNFIGFYLYLVAGVITTITGLKMLNFIDLGVFVSFNPYKGKSQFLQGLLYGGVTLSCTGPILASVLSIVATQNMVQGLAIMGMFSSGFVTPFLLFAFGLNATYVLKKIDTYSRVLNKIGGVVLILVSLYLFYYGVSGVI